MPNIFNFIKIRGLGLKLKRHVHSFSIFCDTSIPTRYSGVKDYSISKPCLSVTLHQLFTAVVDMVLVLPFLVVFGAG